MKPNYFLNQSMIAFAIRLTHIHRHEHTHTAASTNGCSPKQAHNAIQMHTADRRVRSSIAVVAKQLKERESEREREGDV